MDMRKVYKLQVYQLSFAIPKRWRWILCAPTGRLMAMNGMDHATRRGAWLAAVRVQDLLKVPCTLTVVTPDTGNGAAGRKAANAKAGRTGRTTSIRG